MFYNATDSAPTSNSYIYDGTDIHGTAFQAELSVNMWDDSAMMFITPSYSHTTNGGIFRGKLDVDIAPGDYVSFNVKYKDSAGNPLTMAVYDADQPYYEVTNGDRILATAIRYFAPDEATSEDYAYIYAPSAGNLIHNPSSNEYVLGDGAGSPAGSITSSASHSTVTITDTSSSTYAGIEALTGGDNTYITYSLDSDPATVSLTPRAIAIDLPNSGPSPAVVGLSEYTWHMGNISENTFSSDTEFGFTLDGAIVVPVPVPEPSSTALQGLSLCALFTRRHRA